MSYLSYECQGGAIVGQMGLSCALRSSFASPAPSGRRLRSLARSGTYCLNLVARVFECFGGYA
ncbi:hypothetical protein FEI15_08410 [Lacticaseibacillus zeae]|uniref:Uncharacterized protein n=1 Tax=Lacticaseibacillus zeae TaxID=57037 RepID=A0A5R8LP85_LACZE|nr:hypothetical protein FEI14_13630 [Lacticaseibacillus zeae]TLF39047.1 hypothetical protein FEI15_08410 [Lacticaseibacillus zeae]